MLVAISAPTFDPDGHVQLDAFNNQTSGETRRRVNRVATLDGSAVFNDFGFSEADRTIDLRWVQAARAIEEAVDRLVQLNSRLIVSMRTGVYLAAPESYTPGTESRLLLLVESKLSE